MEEFLFLLFFVCACVRACVRACLGVCVGVCCVCGVWWSGGCKDITESYRGD